MYARSAKWSTYRWLLKMSLISGLQASTVMRSSNSWATEFRCSSGSSAIPHFGHAPGAACCESATQLEGPRQGGVTRSQMWSHLPAGADGGASRLVDLPCQLPKGPANACRFRGTRGSGPPNAVGFVWSTLSLWLYVGTH